MTSTRVRGQIFHKGCEGEGSGKPSYGNQALHSHTVPEHPNTMCVLGCGSSRVWKHKPNQVAWFTDTNSLMWKCPISSVNEPRQAGYPWCMTGLRHHIFSGWIMGFSVAEHFHTVMLTNPYSCCISQKSCEQHQTGIQSHWAAFSLIQFFFISLRSIKAHLGGPITLTENVWQL